MTSFTTLQDLVRSPPEGITFVPNEEETLMEIHAEIQGPGEGGDGGFVTVRAVTGTSHKEERVGWMSHAVSRTSKSTWNLCLSR